MSLNYGWIWMFIGLGLMVLELIAPGFVIFFFGLAAATVGLVWFALGGGEAFGVTWQIVMFTALSIVYLLTLRRIFKSIFVGTVSDTNRDFDNDYAGRTGKVTEAVKPPLTGRVEIGDAEWTATADAPIEAGATVKVISQNNLTMKIEEIK